eukprot:3291685-Alexandrium_andersonii.AAC.1
MFRPGKGRGKGGKPATPEALGGPASTGGAEGADKGCGPFAGRCRKCNEVGRRAADSPSKPENS